MRRVLKWILFGVVGLVVVVAAVGGALALIGSSKLAKEYAVEPEPVVVTQDEAAVERGRYLYSIDCVGCHGENLAGTELFSQPGLATISPPNLTAGSGGIGGEFSDEDLVRAIRHGVDPEGRPLVVMPSRAFWYFSDEDLAAVIAYIRSVPPVDKEPGPMTFGPLGRLMVGAGIMDALAAESIDHNGPRPAAASEGLAYGEYVVNISDCRSCHGPELTGGKTPEPGAPPAPNIAASVGTWTLDGFVKTIRTGMTPDGRPVNAAYMPWPDYARMTDEDLAAVYNYISSQ